MPEYLRGRARPVTIDQVAQRSGVSKTTVSRYLNGRYDALSLETRERIRDVIAELDYRPNRIAQSLKARSSRMIGCLVGDIGNPFSSILVKGVNSVCAGAGYQLLFANSDDDARREREAIRDLIESQVDGLIVNTTGQNDDFLVSLREQGIPLVLADRSISRGGLVDTVTTDNYGPCYACVKFLRDAGYRHVAFFTQGNGCVMPRILRYRAYCDAMRDFYGQDGGTDLYQFVLDDRESCLGQLKTFRKKYAGERVAVFAVNGQAMLRMLQAIQVTGFSIGAQFGVCGFDDWGWASLIPPGITTIAQDSWTVGQHAAQLLLERIAGRGPEKPVCEELPNRLELRGSTVKGA